MRGRAVGIDKTMKTVEKQNVWLGSLGVPTKGHAVNITDLQFQSDDNKRHTHREASHLESFLSSESSDRRDETRPQPSWERDLGGPSQAGPNQMQSGGGAVAKVRVDCCGGRDLAVCMQLCDRVCWAHTAVCNDLRCAFQSHFRFISLVPPCPSLCGAVWGEVMASVQTRAAAPPARALDADKTCKNVSK